MIEGGSRGTYHGTGAASIRRGHGVGVVGGDFWNTDGFAIVREDLAGPIDIPLGTTNRAVSGKVGVGRDAARCSCGRRRDVDSGGERPTRQRGSSAVRRRARRRCGGSRLAAACSRGAVRQPSAVVRARASPSTRRARPRRRSATAARPPIPRALTAQWTQMVRERHELSAGVDVSSAAGTFSEKFTFVGDRPTREREVERHAAHRRRLRAGRGRPRRRRAPGGQRARRPRAERRRPCARCAISTRAPCSRIRSFSDRTTSQLTYSLGTRWQQTEWLGWRASVYEAFRAPSMYEMYFPRFSSRGTVTEGNAQLDAERMRGLEAGLDLTPCPRCSGG